MAEITSITVQAKDKNRCNIYLDNVFFCGLQTETVMKYALKKGDIVTEDKLLEIQFDSEKSKALDKAFSYIEKSIKTEKQISDYLKGKGYTERVIAYVLEKLRDYNFANDLTYAKTFVRSANGKKGKRLLGYELAQKGIDEKQIEEALCDYESDEDAIYIIAKKHIKDKERDIKNLQKTYKYLLSKGFSYEEASRAIDKLKGEE